MANNIINPDLSTSVLSRIKSVYFIGIGGISMSSLAMISKAFGIRVAGSDSGHNPMIDKLIENGITVNPEHRAEQIEGFDAVVYTAAVNETNPELKAAKESKTPVFTRAEYLGQLMLGYDTRIGVSGMHGKSTTTSMIAHIFYSGGYDPTVVNGAVCDEFGGAYRLGSQKHFIFEACEYTDSFLSFSPTTAVVLNIDMDHPDYFHSLDQIIDSYSKYMSLASAAVINADDENIKKAEIKAKTLNSSLKTVKFGIQNPDADFTASDIVYENGGVSFDIYRSEETKKTLLCRAELSIPGEHGVYDALAAFAASYINGADTEKITAALRTFSGAKRRLEFKGKLDCGASLYDDYAHHPTEIKATLAGVKKLGFKRTFCIFQPHTFTRTAELFDEFSSAFADTDTVIFADIYAARETNQSGVSSSKLAENTPNGVYVGGFEEIAEYISSRISADDVILTMGAGDVYKIGNLLIK